MTLYLLYLGCLLLSSLSALINLKALKSRQLSVFAIYLTLLTIQEVIIFFYARSLPPGVKGSTGIVYNIYRPIACCIFVYFYYHIPFNTAGRKIILVMTAVYLVMTLINFSFFQSIRAFNSYLSVASGLVIACCGIFFLFNYFNLDDQAEERKWIPVLWITGGILAYYPVVSISFSFYQQLLAYNAKLLNTMLYNSIPRVMSIFMYCCFAYAFYLCRKKV